MRRHLSERVLSPVLLVFLICALPLYTGCSSETSPVDYKNAPPTVWIAAGPPEGSVSGYRVGFRWGGWDPDGKIGHYEYCITDNDGTFDPADTTGADKWTRTTKTRDVFVFSADVPTDPQGDDLVAEFRRSHTFFIRSVDEAGLPSPRPAYRSFTARTLSPEVDIVSPPRVVGPTAIGHITTIRWVATDYIDDESSTQEPESVSWILEPASNHNDDLQETIDWIRALPVDDEQWGEWVDYGQPDDAGKQWTTPPLDYGQYVFAIRARDEAGAVTPVFDEDRNLRQMRVVSDVWPPQLTVYNEFMGSIVTTGFWSPLTIMDFPAAVPIEFEWSAGSSVPGVAVVAYRYGWDIADPQDPAQWAIDWTQFEPAPPGEPVTAGSQPITFYYGTHVFRVEVMNEYGYVSAAEVKINLFQFHMTRPLLLVDDSAEGEWAGWQNPVGLGIMPDDAEHDAFWLGVLDGVDGFRPEADAVDVSGGAVMPLALLADYESLIWNVLAHVDQTGDYPVLYDLIRFRPKDGEWYAGGKIETNLLALYMAAGGHLLLCGQHPVSMAINDTWAPGLRFPVMFQYELDLTVHDQSVVPDPEHPTGDESYAFRDLCLESMDFAWTDAHRWRPPRLVCPEQVRNNPPGAESQITMRSALPIDPAFPQLDLRPEAGDPGRWYDPAVRGVDAELYNPSYFHNTCRFMPRVPRPCFQPIYGLGCLDVLAPGYNQPVAFWTSVYADVAAGAPGSVAARSAVFGFQPVLFHPAAGKAAIERILFDEWQLPRRIQ